MKPDVLLVTNGHVPMPTILAAPWAAGRIAGIDMYDFNASVFEDHPALWFTLNTDQRQLQRVAGRLDRYLDRGGTIVYCGHIAWPFLPELSPFEPLRDYKLDDLRVEFATRHPVWDGVVADELTFRKGVAGFYGRGHNPPPPGAEIVNTIAGGTVALDWQVTRPGGGRLLVHAGNDLWGYLDDDNSSARMTRALLDWSALVTA